MKSLPNPARATPSESISLASYDHDLEAAVLGTVLNDGRLARDLFKVLKKPATFHRDVHQDIYQAMFALFDRSEEIDLISVRKQYERMGFGQSGPAPRWAHMMPAYLMEIANGGNFYSSLSQKALFLFELAIKRYMGEFGGRLMQRANDPATDALQLMEDIRKAGDQMIEQVQNLAEKSAADYLNRAIDNISRQQQTGTIAGLSTGVPSLDKVTGGMKPGNLIVLAGRPAMGKSAVALFMVLHLTLTEQRPVGLVSMEMTGVEVMQRMIAAETGYSNFQLDQGRCDLAVVHQRIGRLSTASLHIHDQPITLTELRLKALEWKRRHNIELLVVDYLQLMEVPGAKDERARVSQVSRGLKRLAAELDIPVLALSQLSRKCEDRKDFDKRPYTSDLSESGTIEQDANCVWFLFRPMEYGLNYPDGSVTDKTLEFHIAKTRNGPKTDRNNPLLLSYDKAINVVTDWDAAFAPLKPGEEGF